MEKISLYQRSQIRPVLEEFGFGVELFRNWTSSTPTPHGHDVLEINYIAKGRARQISGQSAGELDEGTLTVVNYGLEHAVITDEGGIDIINIYIDIARVHLPPLDAKLTAVLRNVIPLHPVSVNNLNKVIQLRMEDAGRFESILCAIIDETAHRRTGFEQAVRQYFSLFLIMMCRSAESNGLSSVTANGRGFEKIEGLLKYLEDNCHKHLELDAIANIAGLDKHYLCREFKRITGRTIFEYLLSRRLQKAMYELRTTDKKIIDIALDSGFANISNFNRQFKQSIKTTPTGYRGQGVGFVKMLW